VSVEATAIEDNAVECILSAWLARLAMLLSVMAADLLTSASDVQINVLVKSTSPSREAFTVIELVNAPLTSTRPCLILVLTQSCVKVVVKELLAALSLVADTDCVNVAEKLIVETNIF
jgi:hypothetical protein